MKPEPQRIRWTVDSFTVIDASQTLASVRAVLQMSRTSWIVVCRRDPSAIYWYVFSNKEFQNQLETGSLLKRVRDVIALSDSKSSQAVQRRDEKVAPQKYAEGADALGRVVLVEPDTNRIKAIGSVPVLVPRMEFQATKASVPARGTGEATFRGGNGAVKKAAKKAAKKAGAFRRAYEPTRRVSKLFDVVQVMFATDRQLSSSEATKCKFSNDRCDDNQIRYGICEVSIPKSHKVGIVESPSWLHLQIRCDPAKHVSVMRTDVLTSNRFFAHLQMLVGASSAKDALIFVHGYNVSFEDGARRTAQIAYDLKFQGAPILYSWPSKARLHEYAADAASVDLSASRFRKFLLSVAQSAGAKTLHVIAHSMGNRALLLALEQLAAQHPRPTIHNVILTAPDIDAERFKQIAAAIQNFPVRTTLYASSRDQALKQSERLYQAHRAGESGKDIVVVKGVDTVDASSVDTNLFSLGHSYFGNKRTVLRDIYELLQGKPPDSRFELCAQTCPQGMYWAFKP